MDANTARTMLSAPFRGPQRFVASWRDEDTAQAQSVAVIAYSETEAREIVAELIGHYNIKVVTL